eukprot:gene9185-6609_t
MYEPFELTQDMSMDKETTAAPAVVDTEQFDFQPVVSTVQKVKANKSKRRKVEINDRVEIPDKIWKQRLANVDAILRPPTSVLIASCVEPTIEESFDDITGNMQYCPELRDLVGIFSDSAQQLAHLRIREGQSQESHLPEVTRRESGIEMTDAASVRDFDVGRQSVDNSLLQQKRESFMPDISQEYYTQFDYGMDDSAMANKSRESTALAVTSVVRKSLLPDQSSAAVGEISDEQKSERTKAVYSIIEQELQSKESESLPSFCAGCTKAVAARFFLELLQLKTWGKIELTQPGAYEPIHVELVR